MTYESKPSTWSAGTQTQPSRGKDVERFEWEGGATGTQEGPTGRRSETEGENDMTRTMVRVLPAVLGVAIAGYGLYRLLEARSHRHDTWIDRLDTSRSRITNRLQQGLPEAGRAIDQIVGGVSALVHAVRR